MKNNKNIMAKKVVAIGMAASILMGGASFATANSVGEVQNNQEIVSEMEYEFKDMDFLTENERETLAKTNKETGVYYEEISRLSEEVDKMTREIVSKESGGLLEETERIENSNEDLWYKLMGDVDDEQFMIEDNEEFIKASKALTDEEKNTLIESDKKLHEIYEKLDPGYQKAEQATKELNEKIDDLYEKISEAEMKNDAIWEKVFKNEIEK